MKDSSNRAARRRTGTKTGNAQRRDPLRWMYLSLASILGLTIVGFGIARYMEQGRVSAAYATPSPNARLNTKPVFLVDGGAIGAKGLPAHTSQGGSGAPIDGITCLSGMTTEGVFLHIHSHLALFVHGKQMQIPAHIGIVPTPQGGCLYWIHTHDAEGIIHLEAPRLTAPGGGPFRLGMLFDIWGEPLSHTQVGPFKGRVVAYVNGSPFEGSLRAIPLSAHQEITLEVGTPSVNPPFYIFPPND